MLRPLHVVESWRPVVSGYTSRSWELIHSQLNAGGFDPRVLVTSRQFTHGQARMDWPAEGIGHHRLCTPSRKELWLRRVRSFTLDQKALARAIDRAIEEWGADLIHVHWSSGIGRAAASVARRRRIPLVSEVRFDLAGAITSQTLRHSWPALEALLRRRLESHLPHSAAIIAAGPSLAAFLKTSFPTLERRIWTVSNGVHADRFAAARAGESHGNPWRAPGRFLIGSTSNMLYYEGLDLLLEAMALARREVPTLHALLVGGGPESAALRHRARALDVPATFSGPVPATEIPAVLGAIDLFVVPRRDFTITRHAGPLKVVEAMAAGRAIAATPVGDIAHLLGDDRGALVPLGSIPALAQAIVTLSTNRPRREQMGENARRYAEHHLTWSTAAAMHRSVYEAVLHAPPPHDT